MRLIRVGGTLEPDDPLAPFLTKNGINIPNKFLAPHIKPILDKWDTGTMIVERKSKVHQGKVNRYVQSKEYSPLNMLAESLGVNTKKLKEIVDGEGSTRFHAVDRILTELGLTHLWYEDENLALAYSLI